MEGLLRNVLSIAILSVIFYLANLSFVNASAPVGYHLEILTNEEESRLKAVSNGRDIRVRKPGSLADLKARKKFLNEKNLGKICKNKFFNYSEKIIPSRYLKDPKDLRKSVYAEILIHKIIMGSSNFFGSYAGRMDESVDAGEHTLKLLEAYSNKNYPSMDQKKRYGHTVGSAGQFFHASAWAIQLLDGHPTFTKDRKALINQWLKNKILGKHIKFKKDNTWFSAHDGVKNKPIKRKISGIDGINCCSPMGYESGRIQVDNALMAGSILYNDIDAFKSSLKGFVDVIDTMRADGSLPYQTSRGNAAIWYHNLAINVLIAMAEMATYQGVDLYSFKSKNGTDIHDAISFLLNSLENTNLIHKYASRNINPWRSGNGVSNPLDYKFQVGKDKIFKWQGDDRKASFLSWYEIYKYRFPDHDNLKKLHKIAAQTKKRLANSIDLPYEPPTPLYNDYSGMSPSCLYYKHGDDSLEPLDEDAQAEKNSKPKYDRTVAGMKVRFNCLADYAAANDITDLPSEREIESLTTNLEANDYYRSKRLIVKAGISKEAMDANKTALVRLVNYEGTNEEYCAKPVL